MCSNTRLERLVLWCEKRRLIRRQIRHPCHSSDTGGRSGTYDGLESEKRLDDL